MLLTTLQFFVTAGLSIICARALQVSGGDLPLLTFIIPIIWLMSSVSKSNVLLATALLFYGLTVSVQPVELSISTWILFPLLLVAFCKRSTWVARSWLIITMLIMESAVLYCQWTGTISGAMYATLMQIAAVTMVWLSSRQAKQDKATYGDSRHWWALAFGGILLTQGEGVALLVALSLVAMIHSVSTFPSRKQQPGESKIKWSTLLSWTLPTVAFSTFISAQDIASSSLILLIWMVTLAAAWICDYILRLSD
ncbi:hypothetical protein ST37_09700 [Vibrio sp. qd031]|uniref:hypothetical protein n=1 Tax=Vibrio sp. qd031 TaxID=1603038 RepID=UPI000A10AE35|nr:hypothetical protein [Vibrio sp. qd031]ORT50176.1 hypothetical protein ST37_09700 [Vibrio sp. qd031]